MNMEKSKSFAGYSAMRRAEYLDDKPKSYSFNGKEGGELGTEGPELKRRKRVAQYKVYSVEGKLRSSLRNSFKWIKSKFVEDHFQDRSC
ncbi:hypothetical protein LINPERPRIM_LOCUS19850 [Linum perenne]